MSFPQGPPGSPGYPQSQQPTTQFTAPTQQFGKIPDQDFGVPGVSKLPTYLTATVAVLGLLVYLSNFAPQFTMSASDFPFLGEVSGSSTGLGLAMIASLIAALLAGISLLPKQRSLVNIAAVAAVISFLLVIAEIVNKPNEATVDWGLYLVIAFTLLQAAVAVVALLFETGIVKAPVPRPKYDQGQQYGQYPGSYYGQQPGQLQQQRPGYPTPYTGSSGYPSTGPSTGGFSPAPSGQQSSSQAQSGPPTPPTGFPTYGQPPSGSSPGTQQPSTGNGPGAQHPPSSSSQSGQSSS